MAEKISPEEAAMDAADAAGAAEPALPPPAPEHGLEILGPEEETLQTSAGPVKVGSMLMGNLCDFLTHSEKFLPDLQAMLSKGEVNITALIPRPGFLESVAAACGVQTEFLRRLRPDEFIRLATKILVCNLDFFVRTIPRAQGGAELSIVREAARLAGLTRSTTSSGAATR